MGADVSRRRFLFNRGTLPERLRGFLDGFKGGRMKGTRKVGSQGGRRMLANRLLRVRVKASCALRSIAKRLNNVSVRFHVEFRLQKAEHARQFG